MLRNVGWKSLLALSAASSSPIARRFMSSFFSADERTFLAGQIYHKHFLPATVRATDPTDREGFQNAKAELRWIEEWATEEMKSQHSTLMAGSEPHRKTLRGLVESAVKMRVEESKPISLILGTQPFFGADIRVVEPQMTPRQDTEFWTAWLYYRHLEKIAQQTSIHVMDMCCGTGCIGVSLAKQHPNISVVACDVNPQAVQLSQENARRNGVAVNKYVAVESDMFRGVPDGALLHAFDVVVCDPPYIMTQEYDTLTEDVRLYEGRLALVGDERHCPETLDYYKELCSEAPKYLRKNDGRVLWEGCPNLVVEVGLQGEDVAKMLGENSVWKDVKLRLDPAHRPRWVSATLR